MHVDEIRTLEQKMQIILASPKFTGGAGKFIARKIDLINETKDLYDRYQLSPKERDISLERRVENI